MSDTEKKLGFFAKLFGENSTAEDAEKDMLKVEEKVAELTEQLAAANITIEASAKEVTEVNASLGEKVKENETLQASFDETSKVLEAINAAIKEAGFEDINAFVEDHKTVVAHNIELGGTKSSTATPIDNQQTVTSNVKKKKRTYNEVLEASKPKKEDPKEEIKA